MTAPANDNFADAEVITGTTGSVSWDATDATFEASEPSQADPHLDQSVWYSWTSGSSPVAMTFTTTCSTAGGDTYLAVYTGTTLAGLTMVVRDDDSGAGALSSLTFTPDASTTYYIQIANWELATLTGLGLTWDVVPAPPTDEVPPGTPADPVVTSVAPLSGAQVRVFDRDGTTLRGTFAGTDLRWSHGKGVDGPDLAFTASVHEDDYTPTVFDDGLAVVYVTDGVTAWTPVGTPYTVATSGTVLGVGEQAARSVQVTGKGVLGLTAEWLVTHDGEQWNRRGPQTVYFGWQHPDFDDTGWAAPTHTTRASISSGAAKFNNPPKWECAAADWINMPSDNPGWAPGQLTLFRLGSFTVSTAAKYRFASTADEEHKVYLFGPGQGGVITEDAEQETGYTYSRRFNEVLAPGTYFVAAEMTTVNSAGGDGFDALSFYVGPVGTDDTVSSFVLHSGSSGISCLRQSKTAPRPGLTIGQLLMILKSAAVTDLGAGSSAGLLARSGFNAVHDSAGVNWPDLHERSWSPGTTVAQVLSDLGDLADFDVTATFRLQAFTTRGADLSASIALVPGSSAAAADENLLSYTFTTTPITATRVAVLTEDGYVVRGTGDRSTYLESAQSSSIGEGTALADRYIAENGSIRVVFTAQFIGLAGAVPGLDFSWGDIVAGLDRTGAAADVQVLTWAGSRQSADGAVVFDVELQ